MAEGEDPNPASGLEETSSPDPPTLEPLPSPRALIPAERALLDAMVNHAGVSQLRAQVADAKVVSECACGCPSIGLTTSGPVVPADIMLGLEPSHRDDWALIDAWGLDDRGRQIAVNLHVMNGRLQELEVWAGWDGDVDPVSSIPTADTLTFES